MTSDQSAVDVDPAAAVAAEGAALAMHLDLAQVLELGLELDDALVVVGPPVDHVEDPQPQPLLGTEVDGVGAGRGVPGGQEVELVMAHVGGVARAHQCQCGGRRHATPDRLAATQLGLTGAAGAPAGREERGVRHRLAVWQSSITSAEPARVTRVRRRGDG